MKNRGLFLINPDDLHEELIRKLCEISQSFDETIYVVTKADEFNNLGVTTGQLLVWLHKLLILRSSNPFFLIPFATKGAIGINTWLKLKLLTPSFNTLYSNKEDEAAARLILNCKFEPLPVVANDQARKITFTNRSIKRGLYITRAQPFHNGHAAFVKQMAEECDELIILLAAAELSHLPQNPLSASERLEMLHEYLNANFSGKYYLIALPQNTFTLENMHELRFLLPEFQVVYGTNPIILSMCASLKIPVESLHQKVTISATEIRNKILNGEPYDEDVPPNILAYLSKIGLQERLQLLNHEFKR